MADLDPCQEHRIVDARQETGSLGACIYDVRTANPDMGRIDGPGERDRLSTRSLSGSLGRRFSESGSRPEFRRPGQARPTSRFRERPGRSEVPRRSGC